MFPSPPLLLSLARMLLTVGREEKKRLAEALQRI